MQTLCAMLFALCQYDQLNDLNDPNLLTFVIFYLKKFLLACGTLGSLAILGCETCVIISPDHFAGGYILCNSFDMSCKRMDQYSFAFYSCPF